MTTSSTPHSVLTRIGRELPQNWDHWPEKEADGVNRGYPAAFINTNHADHFVLISQADLRDEYKVTVKPYTNGDWKPDWSPSNEQVFTGTHYHQERLFEKALSYAVDWMENHPCPRSDPPGSVAFLTDLFHGLERQNIAIQHDASVDGVIRPDHADATSHNIRLYIVTDTDELMGAQDFSEADIMKLYVNIDGEHTNALTYRNCTDNTDSQHEHEPVNQSVLHDPIANACDELGLDEVTVKNGGYQTYFDQTTGYNITALIPDTFPYVFADIPSQQQGFPSL